MGTLLLYILKSTICLTLFYIGFKALLSNDTFFRFNRWVMLGGMSICMLLPVFEIKTAEPLLIQQPFMHLEEMIMGEGTNSVALSGGASGMRIVPAVEPAVAVDWGQLLFFAYLIGVLICLMVTLLSFRKMFVLIRSGRKLQQERYTLILTSDAVSPFSWGRYIILSENEYEKHPDEILTHEKIHLESRHSVDLLFMEVILWLHWFNPAAWLLKRELKDIHEYQADKGVLAQGIDATKYQLLLVKKAVGSSLYTLANSFNHSKIKKRITMMLKKKSNNWARLKLALLVPVGFAALSAFARPETSPPPAATMTDNIHLSINKSTVNQETMQQDHAVFLTYKESGSEDLNSIVCKTLDRIRTRVAEGQFKNALEVTVNPAFDDIPASYLETVKDVLEERDIKCKIDMTVPNTIMDDVAKPYRKYDDVVYLIQNKKIVAALSISKFSANQNDPRLDKISKSASLILQPENPKVSRQEMEKLKNLLDKKGLTSEINMNIFKIGDAAAPPPPPPAGQVIFSYRDGQPDQQFVLYDRHAKPGANLGQRIDKIYKDNITKVSIKINKSTPKDLLETVKQELKKKINYPVQYEILQFVD